VDDELSAHQLEAVSVLERRQVRCPGASIPALLRSAGAAWHLAGHLRLESWQGVERVQLLIDDAAPAGQAAPG
jgi:hypothetical protein